MQIGSGGGSFLNQILVNIQRQGRIQTKIKIKKIMVENHRMVLREFTQDNPLIV